jgi:hypothetical protein
LEIPSDGKDFWVGYLTPSYNSVIPPATLGFYGAYLLISSYSDNNVTVSFFDRISGSEVVAGTYFVSARTAIQVPLQLPFVKMGDTGDVAEYAACHVSAKRPVNIEFFSTGACAGGSFLPLQTSILGKKYVIASYNDNNGEGGIIGTPTYGASRIETSKGLFEIIAPFDSTSVTIIPTTTTMGGHIGISGVHSTGKPVPYTVLLHRGQCYLVVSGGSDDVTDISGSVVESDKPIAVIAGHQNAFLGGVSGRNLEGRDFMVEQMLPIDYWDTAGYVSIPLKDSQPDDPAVYSGTGDNYRVFTYDSIGTFVRMSQVGVSNPGSTYVGKYGTIEQSGILEPVDFTTTNSVPFGVMLYDQRNFANKVPFPAPSMMTIIPISRWKTSFIWYVPANKFEILQNYYINIIAKRADLDSGIVGSFNGGQIKPIKNILSLDQQYDVIPNHPEFVGVRFAVNPGCYYAHCSNPFIVYNYGFRAMSPNFALGSFDGDDYYFSYALPVGFSISGGTHIGTTVDTQCNYWNICAYDTSFGSTKGLIKEIDLIDDATGDTYGKPITYYNARLDPALDSTGMNSIILNSKDSFFCFKVYIPNGTDSAFAPLFIVDDQGGGVIVQLHYHPPAISLHPDTGRFGLSLNQDSCETFVLKNSSKAIADLQITSANLKYNTHGFILSSLIPTLPTILKPGDSLSMTVCYTAKDTSTQKDTLIILAPCLKMPIDLKGSGYIPIIYASDHDFGPVIVDSTKCDTVGVYNMGKEPFILTNQWVLDNMGANFSFASTGISPAKGSSDLPLTLNPRQKVLLDLCYTPHSESSDSTTIFWGTTLSDPYKHSTKDFSRLIGEGVKIGFEWDRALNVMNACGDTTITRVYLQNGEKPGAGSPVSHVDSVFIIGPNSTEFYILDNKLGYTPLKNFSIRPGDSIWIDIVFKPDLTKPPALRYADRHAQLVAADVSEKNKIIDLTGTWCQADVKRSDPALSFSVHPNPVSGNSVIISLPDGTKGTLAIYDVLGREVYRKDIVERISQMIVPIYNFENGMYYARVATGKAQATEKFEVVK